MQWVKTKKERVGEHQHSRGAVGRKGREKESHTRGHSANRSSKSTSGHKRCDTLYPLDTNSSRHFRWFVFISCPDHMQVTPDARDICQRVTLGRHAAPHTGAGNLKFGRGRVTPSREKVWSSARSKIQQMEGNSQLTAEPHSNGSEPGWDLVARLSDSSDF